MTKAKQILLVDDDPDILDQVTIILQGDGFDVLTAGSEAEAEEALLSGKPDLAILDLMMENKDSGFVLCHQIKKLYPELPVILLTAVKAATGISFNGATADARSWVKADCLMDKPVLPETLRREVRSLLRIETTSDNRHAH